MLTSNYDIEIAQLKNQQDSTDVTRQIEELNGKNRKLVEHESLAYRKSNSGAEGESLTLLVGILTNNLVTT